MIIIDAEGAERDWAWVKEKYNLPEIDRASKKLDHWEILELREVIGPASMTVRLVGKQIVDVRVIFGWPDDHVLQKTDTHGQTGFGMGPGAYYRPDRGERGPHWVYVEELADTDFIGGLGMVGKTNHAHLEPTFAFMKGEEPLPPPDCEEYRIAMDKIREIVKAFPPLVD